MRSSIRLAAPITAACVATIVLSNFAMVMLAGRADMSAIERLQSIWPMALTSGVAIVLVMSFLYSSLLDFVRELAERENYAYHQAFHDALTGLPNRALLADRLDRAITQSRRSGLDLAVLTIDIDRFKLVNDTLGHQAGDELIREIARRLEQVTRETDTVARIGGDEFAVVEAELEGEDAVERLCRRILEAIREPFSVAGRQITASVSIGAAIGNGCATGEELQRKSDIALYSAKASGRDCHAMFTEKMDATVQRTAKIEDRLRRALAKQDGLSLRYQPLMDRSGKQVIGAEALLSWRDQLLGEVSTAETVAVAEECNLIHQLGEWAFTEACRISRRLDEMCISVNVSPSQLRVPDLVERFTRIATRHGADPAKIELEITETGLGTCYQLRNVLQELRDVGFPIALDDFGTGFSSLGNLQNYPIDKIKLDPAFFSSIEAEEEALTIVAALVSLGHAMDLKVAAQGIETEMQERIAISAGCDQLQGFHLAEPMNRSALERLLKNQPARAAA
ncbi:MAG: putative bifunctional diguanylate cyclase/phosphodiesterase [Sphingomonadaceae bacterium]